MTNKKSKGNLFSEKISMFCALADATIKENAAASEEITKLDKLTQDYLHMLELNHLNYKERAKIATKLSKCRQERRRAKDVADITAPLTDFLQADKGKIALNSLKEILGQTRKIERLMNIRSYTYKILNENNIT